MKLDRVLFNLGCALFLAVQFSFAFFPKYLAGFGVGGDDAMVYLFKGAAFSQCLQQDCRALRDLKEQLQPIPQNPQLNYIRHNESNRVLVHYHLLHSYLVARMADIYSDYEYALQTVAAAGAVTMAIAVIWFLRSTFGAGPSGLALILLSFVIFPRQGIHILVPSNMTMAIALLIWGDLLRTRRFGVGNAVAIAVLPLMHTFMGIILGLISVVLGHALEPPPERRVRILKALVVLVLAAAFVATRTIEQPLLWMGGDPPPHLTWTWWDGFHDSVRNAWWSVRDWVGFMGGALFFAITLPAAFFCADRNTRQKLVVFLALMAFACGAALLIVVARHPAEIFHRLWIPLAIFLLGMAATGFWELSVRFFRRPFRWWPALAYGLLLAYPASVLANFLNRESTISGSLRPAFNVAVNDNRHFKVDMRNRLSPNGLTVGYSAEELMHAYLAQAYMDSGASYYPAIQGSPDESRWLRVKDLDLWVAWNPIERLTARRMGVLWLFGERDMRFRVEKPIDWSKVGFQLGNRGGRTEVIRLTVGGQTRSIALAPRSTQWTTFPSTHHPVSANEAIIKPEDDRVANGTITLEGIRLDPEQKAQWPWEKGFQIRWREEVANFSIRELVPSSLTPLEVYSDHDSSVAIRLRH